MTTDKSPRGSGSNRYGAVGKPLVVLVAGVLMGKSYHRDAPAQTPETASAPVERPADCPPYIPALRQQQWPLWGDVTLVVVTLLLFFGVYELLGRGLGWLIASFILPPLYRSPLAH